MITVTQNVRTINVTIEQNGASYEIQPVIQNTIGGEGGGGDVISVNGQTGIVVIDKTSVGLPNADNTSDLDKPVSTATQQALDDLVLTGGQDGADGLSAYEIAVNNGFVGTEAEWLISLEGADGSQGIQGEQGIQGIQGIQGEAGIDGINGTNGIDGQDGYTPIKGVDYFDGADGAQGIQGEQGLQGIQGIQGETGLTGDTGAQGIQGVAGVDGADGTSVNITTGSTDPNDADGEPDGSIYIKI